MLYKELHEKHHDLPGLRTVRFAPGFFCLGLFLTWILPGYYSIPSDYRRATELLVRPFGHHPNATQE